MLTKLFKVEMRAMGRTLLPLFGIGLIATAVSKLISIISEYFFPALSATGQSSPVFEIISTFLMVIVFIFLFGIILVSYIVALQRFYNNLLGDEGYLMFSLPATPAQHMGAKLLAALAWEVCSILLFIFCVSLFSGGPRVEVGFTMTIAQSVLVYTLFIVLLLMAITNAFLMPYASMAIGSRRPQQRLMASAGAFIVIYLIMQVLTVVTIVILGLVINAQSSNPQFLLWISQMSFPSIIPNAICMLFVGIIVIFAIIGTIFWFITKRILSKKLNLA